MIRKFVAVTLMLAGPMVLGAQGTMPKNVLSIQPLNAVFEVFSGEYERAASTSVSWGIGGNFFSPGSGDSELTYTSGEFKLRYYPEGVALQGFSFGGAIGFATVTGNGNGGSDQTAGGPSLGVLLEYQWLMGAKKNFSVALGLGAKALAIAEDEFSSGDFIAKYPTARISIGIAY